jgi:chymotrypsin
MKLFVVLFALIAAVVADDFIEIDWSRVRPAREMATFWKNRPAVLSVNGKSFVRDRKRIVNGQIATPHQFPYQAAVFGEFAQGTALCGGAIISPRTTLTAAHCVDVASSAMVVFGAHFVRELEPTQQRFTIALAGIILHPQWTPSLIQNDVATLQSVNSATYNFAVQPIRLASGARSFENEESSVSGWGRFDDNLPQSSDVLRWYRGTILPQLNCQIRFPGIIQPENICLSGLNNGGACQGDSGGPLTYTDSDGSLHIGIVSFGLALGCEALWPSVFARTSSFNTWINQNTV